MANKYYYNGKLVRTSKTHEYEYGILRGESIIACSETFENATKRLNEEIRYWDKTISSDKHYLEKVLNGIEDDYLLKVGKTREQEAQETRELIARKENTKIQIVYLDKE